MKWRICLLAGLSTPLVLSVHSVVSFDFATSIIPTWHTTIFPPYFVAGAIFGGFAMVLTLLLPARAIFKLHDIITPQHVDKMAKIILLTGSIVGYAYAMEFFVAWYSGNPYEKFAFWNRIFGPYWWYWWVGMLFCNALSPQLFWFTWCRRNVSSFIFVCMCVNAGMWFERFIIIVGGLLRDFLPSSWGMFYPTWVDIWTFIGTFGIFTSLFLLFIRFLPMIAMSEVKIVLPEADPHYVTAWDSIGVRRRKGAHTMMRTPSGHKVYGMAAEYPSAAALYEAAKQVRDAGFKRWDVHSPFPIHGMDEAMGLGKSWLSAVVLCRRHHRFADRRRARIRAVLVHLSADRARKTVQLGERCRRFSRSCLS